MSILLNDNLKIAAPLPVDFRYGPHASLAAAKTAIPESQRYLGLVVAILSGGVPTEYWFKAGITDNDLVVKEAANLATDAISGFATLDENNKLTSNQIPQIQTQHIAALTTSSIGAASAGKIPQLNAAGLIDNSFLSSSITGALEYKGVWNAATNTPSLGALTTAEQGWFYMVEVAGSTQLGAHTDWLIGDLALWDGTEWDKVPAGNEDAVLSINNIHPTNGNVTLGPSDIGAVATASLTTLGGAAMYSGQVPQLTTAGLLATAQFPVATTASLGAVIVGNNLTVDNDGRIHAQNSYVLPAATSSSLGGIKVGSSLSINNEVLNAIAGDNLTTNAQGALSVNTATTGQLGVIQVSTAAGLAISGGIVSLSDATTAQLGGIRVGSNLNISSGTLSVNTATTGQLGVIQIDPATISSNYAALSSAGVFSLSAATSDQYGVMKIGNGLKLDNGFVVIDNQVVMTADSDPTIFNGGTY